MSSFRMKKSYAGRIKQDQEKFIVPGDDINPDPTLLKSAVDGTVIGRKEVFNENQPKTTVSSMRMRKTPYVYADR